MLNVLLIFDFSSQYSLINFFVVGVPHLDFLDTYFFLSWQYAYIPSSMWGQQGLDPTTSRL